MSSEQDSSFSNPTDGQSLSVDSKVAEVGSQVHDSISEKNINTCDEIIIEESNNQTVLQKDISNLPTDVETLQLLVGDLSRRLQNALHIVEAQKSASATAIQTSEAYKSRILEFSTTLRMERNKIETFNRRKMKSEEFERYEREKKKIEKMHEDLRLMMIDHSMSNVKKEPVRLIKMRKQLDKLEKTQSSQKLLLNYLSVQEKMIEDLSNCSQMGDLEGCKDLIRRGVNINEVDSAGFLSIHYAASSGHVPIVQLLLEFGSDATAYLTGVSPMVLAAENGQGDVIKVLASFGVSVEETGSAGTPPIVAAAKNCHLECIEVLISLGANLDAVDVDGNTAMHVAAKHPSPVPVLSCLIYNKASTKISNAQGNTALQVALACLNTPAMEVLGGRTPGVPNIIKNSETGEGCEEMPPLIPEKRSKQKTCSDSSILGYNESGMLSDFTSSMLVHRE
mmetsp:Transcript_25429/g.37494  ORF Transcript_25429/g.37494 Transcript_25429/m.37494 type:complete len:451 (-) Transcript_25429:53-1405(-)